MFFLCSTKLKMDQSLLKQKFLETMISKSATTERSVDLTLIGPDLIAAGFSEDQIYYALMSLVQEHSVVLKEATNRVSFPVQARRASPPRCDSGTSAAG